MTNPQTQGAKDYGDEKEDAEERERQMPRMRRPRGEEHEVLRPVLGGAEERRRGMTGDLPCNAPCACRWCLYNQFGRCTDNAPCEERKKEED